MRKNTKQLVLYGHKAVAAEERGSLIQPIKATCAIVIAWIASILIFPDSHPIVATITAFLAIQPSISQAFRFGAENTVGAILGTSVALILGIAFPGNYKLLIIAGGIVGITIGWILKFGYNAICQMVISTMFVAAIIPTNSGYAFVRVMESLLGAAVGFVVNLIIVPPIQIEPAYKKMRSLADITSSTMQGLSEALRVPDKVADTRLFNRNIELMKHGIQSADQAVEKAKESMLLNHKAKKMRAKFDDDVLVLFRLERIAGHLIGMLHVYMDSFTPELSKDSAVKEISRQLNKAAHDTQLFKRQWKPNRSNRFMQKVIRNKVAVDTTPPTSAIPILTTPLRVTKPDPIHWVAIGSMLADLKRIHDLVTGRIR
ncbi:FUSC family protein [Tropheryma whipplei]|nr:FUSC family protein [Tropheryma whipplei]MCO8182351.1 FUSC family protein [Tropheryma whipplei]